MQEKDSIIVSAVSLFHLVFGAECGIRLYWFLTIAFLFIFYNDFSVRIESSVTWGNSSASFDKPRDAEQLPSWRNFQSAPHNH